MTLIILDESHAIEETLRRYQEELAGICGVPARLLFKRPGQLATTAEKELAAYGGLYAKQVMARFQPVINRLDHLERWITRQQLYHSRRLKPCRHRGKKGAQA